MVTRQVLTLDRLAREIDEELVAESDLLDPADVSQDPIICSDGSLADGFHRTAGMIAWARSRGLELADVPVDVVVIASDDPRVCEICGDTKGSREERRALESIYAEAYG